MVDKCKNCGAKIVKFPLKDENGKFLWKNLFKMDWYSILLFIIVMGMVIAYKADIETCEKLSDKIEEDPCIFCDKNQGYNPTEIDLGLDIIDINNPS